MTSNTVIEFLRFFYIVGLQLPKKQKRTHKFEIFTIALTDKTDVENIFFLSQLMHFAEI